MAEESALEQAEALLQNCRTGVMSTLSARVGGWPFGSVVPYAVSKRGEPIILIAEIAEHTKNIKVDDRVSILVHEPVGDGDIQAKGRLTVMGHARPVPKEELRDVSARYLARVPDAIDYETTHDFSYYAVTLERLRYIGGFGKIHWLEPQGFGGREDPLAAGAHDVIVHMNADHKDALVACAKASYGIDPLTIEMVGIDAWGIDCECTGPNRRLRFELGERATPENVRRVVVALTARARHRLAEKQ